MALSSARPGAVADSAIAAVRRGGSRGVARIRGPLLAPALAVGLLAALTLTMFARQLFGHWTFPWDFLSHYLTTPPFVAATIGSGHPLWWSPFVASGFPVDVNPQAGVFFPLWWAFGALGVPLYLTTVTAVQVAHVWLGALGVLALARARRLTWPWATVAAVAYLFFGGFYGQAEHSDYIRGFAYLPWLLWSLTPPAEGQAWRRLAATPLLAWLIASGGYPGQLPAFSIVAFVYVGAELLGCSPAVRRRHWPSLVLATVASAAACVAVLAPYLLAEHHHDLVRTVPATASVRSYDSFSPTDVLGLELNSFAWHPDGSTFSWALALPVLIGLALSTLASVRRHLALLACGVVALALATTPKLAPIGKAMVSLGTLFPSRFPAADYKPAVAIALILLSVEAWASFSARRGRRWPTALAGLALALGVLLAPSTYAAPTRTVWLALAVIAATMVLIALRPRLPLLVGALLALIVIDGVREARDYRTRGGVSAWQAPPAAATMPPDVAVTHERAYDRYVARLPELLRFTEISRPARLPASVPLSVSSRGANPDAAGWVADGYRLVDYAGPVERALWRVEQSPTWTRLMLEPWHAYVFQCRASGCSRALPPAQSWHPSRSIHTVAYGPDKIVYKVHLTRPALMVENELAIRGWRSNTPRAEVINAGIPLRTWQLRAGSYTFTASYHEPGRGLQIAAAAIALLAWLGCAGWLLVERRGYSRVMSSS
jgi:hypothetical protein